MEQFLTGDVWKQVNKLLYKRQRKIACIAYVTSEKLKLSKGDILICDASEQSIKFAKTSAKTLKNYLQKGVTLYSTKKSLHSKLLLTDKFLVIGSANLSSNSAERLTEASILTTNPLLVSPAKAFCHSLIKQDSVFLSKTEVDDLLKIKVIRSGTTPGQKTKTRETKFGNQYWFTSVGTISDKLFDKIKDDVDKTTSSISKRNEIEEDDISFLRMRNTTKLSSLAKEGDQIVVKLQNENNTQSFVYPPSTILYKEVIDKFTYLYYDDRNSEETKISWTKFQAFLKKEGVSKPDSTRTRVISPEEIDSLKTIWRK